MSHVRLALFRGRDHVLFLHAICKSENPRLLDAPSAGWKAGPLSGMLILSKNLIFLEYNRYQVSQEFLTSWWGEWNCVTAPV